MIQIEIKGIESARNFIEKAGKEAYVRANKAIIKSGFYIQGEIQSSIAGQRAETRSVDTGRFLNSIKAEQKQPLTSTISSNVKYSKFLEYGTSRMKPRAHFRNTVARNELKVKEFVEKELKKIT